MFDSLRARIRSKWQTSWKKLTVSGVLSTVFVLALKEIFKQQIVGWATERISEKSERMTALVASMATWSVEHPILFGVLLLALLFVSCCVFLVIWAIQSKGGGVSEKPVTGGPVVLLELRNGLLDLDQVYDVGFMKIRNVGERVASRVKILDLVHGVWRMEFKEIYALAPSSHTGDSSHVEYVVYEGNHQFGSSSSVYPESALVTFLNQWNDLLVRLPMTISYEDGSRKVSTVAVIEYDAVRKSIRVDSTESCLFAATRSVPLIEENPVSDALNLQITNLSPFNLEDSKLLLHGLSKWGEKINQFHEVPEFKSFSTVTLYSNQTSLPIEEPRRFQLLEFKNPAAPVIRAKIDPSGAAKEWPIPSHGLWRMNLELRWQDGAPYPFHQCFRWDYRTAPTFDRCP